MSRKLKEDLAEAQSTFKQEGSFIKDLQYEDDSISFTFSPPKRDPTHLTLFCADYPGSCTLYTEDGEPKEYSGKLTVILDKIMKEKCKALKIEAPTLTFSATQPAATEAKPTTTTKKAALKKSRGSDDEEEEEEYSDEDYEHGTEAGFEAAETSELLKKDTELFKSFFGKRALTTREFSDIDTIDLELHLNVEFLGASVSDAWGVDRDVPVVCRLSMSPSSYVHATNPPKVEVFQNSIRHFGLKSQLTKIVTDFVKAQWGKEDSGRRSDVAFAVDDSSSKGKEKETKAGLFGSIGKFFTKDEPKASTHKDKDVASLMEMGFSHEQAINALSISSDVTEALNLLLSDPDSCTDENMKKHREREEELQTKDEEEKSSEQNNKRKRRAQKPNASERKRQQAIKKSRTEEPHSTNNPQTRWEEFEKTATDAKSRIPSRDHGFLVQVLLYLQERIPSLSNYCVICDQPHVFANGAMLKPAVCSRELCCFAFQQLGVMSDAADDIATEAEVVDLLICMATAAASSTRCSDIFDPYPTIFDPDNPKKILLSPNAKDFDRVRRVLSSFPAVQRLSQAKDCMEMKDQLDKADKLSYPFLQWLISSNRSHIVKLSQDKHLKSMITPYQYVLLSSPPEKEEKFRRLKEEHGSVFAFHGSRVENWHSILRHGLKNASGTKLQLNGAAYGSGIYLSPHSGTSFGYSQFHGGRGGGLFKGGKGGSSSSGDKGDRRFLSSSNFHCIALCEVINHSSVRKSGNIWVCPEPDYVVTRFFFVYDESHTGGAPTVQTGEGSFLREIENALSP